MDTAGQTCVSLNVEQVPVPCSIENRHPYPGACPHDYSLSRRLLCVTKEPSL